MIFSPKSGPTFTKNRFLHFLWGVSITATGGLFGYQWGAIAFGSMITLAFLLEMLTAVVNKVFFNAKWKHPYGDFVDLIAYVIGGLVPAIIMVR